MNISSVYLNNYRNFREFTTSFSDGVNIITGDNAQGKTNLLECVYYFTTGRSFRAAREKELILFHADFARMTADICFSGRSQKLDFTIFRDKARVLKAGGARLKRASELTGKLAVVLFTPNDLSMIRDGAHVRRKLMDLCLCQLRPRYNAALSEFSRLYAHKTRILRDCREKPSLLDALDDFSYRLAQQSAIIIYYRSAFASFLSEKATGIHEHFSGGSERLTLRYKTVGNIDAAGKKPGELLEPLLEHQRLHRQAELTSGLCLSGAHKDDLEIEIDGSPARKFASQGQARTAAISIKLAERDIFFDDRGEYPLLLLDDVLSELDSSRRDFLLNRVRDGQVFITCCDDDSISKKTGGNVLYIKNGELVTV